MNKPFKIFAYVCLTAVAVILISGAVVTVYGVYTAIDDNRAQHKQLW